MSCAQGRPLVRRFQESGYRRGIVLMYAAPNDASPPELRVKMKNSNQATHNHKRVGAVIVLRSTAELAEVQIPSSSDHFWVRLTDLTELAETIASGRNSQARNR